MLSWSQAHFVFLCACFEPFRFELQMISAHYLIPKFCIGWIRLAQIFQKGWGFSATNDLLLFQKCREYFLLILYSTLFPPFASRSASFSASSAKSSCRLHWLRAALSQLKILHLFIGLFKTFLVLRIESIFLGCDPQRIKQFDYCMILKKFTWTQKVYLNLKVMFWQVWQQLSWRLFCA